MSLNRYDKRKDANHAAILRDLRKLGYAVIEHNGPGEPDLVVMATGFHGWQVCFAELKVKTGKLNKRQIEWRDQWRGPPPIIARCTEDIVKYFNRLSARKSAEKREKK